MYEFEGWMRLTIFFSLFYSLLFLLPFFYSMKHLCLGCSSSSTASASLILFWEPPHSRWVGKRSNLKICLWIFLLERYLLRGGTRNGDDHHVFFNSLTLILIILLRLTWPWLFFLLYSSCARMKYWFGVKSYITQEDACCIRSRGTRNTSSGVHVILLPLHHTQFTNQDAM